MPRISRNVTSRLLLLAVVVVAGSRVVPEVIGTTPHEIDLVALAFGLLFCLPEPRRSGLVFPGKFEWRVVVVCVIPVLAVLATKPLLPQPFAGERMGFWLISPLAQDLVFLGFLYGLLEPSFKEHVHPHLHVRRVLVVLGVLFAAWHLPNLRGLSVGYVAFQMCFTFAGVVFVGLTRQWTGSVFYATGTHMAVNWIATW